MLDDSQFVSRLDKSNALGVIAGQPDQLKQDFDFELSSKNKPTNIVLAGMGGSALAAEFINSWLLNRLPVPLTITRDYALPAWLDKDSLVLISSYSGNTEESLSCLQAALKRKLRVVVISSGGQLQNEAKANKLTFIALPTGLQPRLAVLFEVKAISALLEKFGLVSGLTGELAEAADWMSAHTGSWSSDSSTASNQAKQIAEELFNNPIVVYAGPTLAYAAMKWKIDFNENSKNLAFYYIWPEFDHNEFQGWRFPKDKTFKVVELQSKLDNDQIAKRFDISNRLLSGQMPSPIIIWSEGKSKLQQMLWAVILGDFVSAYLAFLNGIDPTPVELVEKLKKELQ
ncbi:MAG TPA: bifunctional phosphoglucose/phosphomannose isomerase [Candidatus Nanoarchaeia archaeon]|nr:bifunctional phosphoglucose/phosphomannose isomerase [Candidatus Nanoarchaeia archaeon]